MNYRGRDLDLRTLERGPMTGAHWQAESQVAGSGALLVDEVVLACCNHAYDLALAHRAREVRIEHLLNAMTRTDAAITVLAGHGIDIAGLRQDTAQVIATDEATIPGHERVSPRRSQVLADVLNMAAAMAMQRNASATIADILRALLELNSEQSGLVMLKRNAPGWQQRSASEMPRPEPLPPLLGGAYQYDPRYAHPDPRHAEAPREWVRMPAGQAHYYPSAPPGYFGGDPAATQPQTYYAPEPAVAAPSGNLTDAVQNTRLDQLERTIRELTGELLAERKAVNQLAGEIKREVAMQPEPPGRVRVGYDERLAENDATAAWTNSGPTHLADQLQTIERSVEAKFADIARGWSVLGERLQALEQAVAASRVEQSMPSNLVDQLQGLDNIGSTLAMLADRLSGIERQLQSKSTTASVVNLEPIVERLAAIENAQQLRPAATSQALAPVIERLAAIERAQSSRPSAAAVDLHPVLDRIAAMERSLANRVQSVDLTPVLDRLGAIDTRVSQFERKLDAGSSASQHNAERLRAIEEALIAQRNQVAQLATNMAAEIKSLAQGVSAQSTTGERIQSLLGERAGQLTTLIGSHRSETSQSVTEVSNKITALEKVIQGFGQRTLELHAAHGADLVELHNAMLKLNTNQQTLAGTLEQWRVDNGTELSTLLTRLDGVERSSAKPMQVLENLQTNMQNLQRITLKREEQRGRFKQWLMGTDDWYGASWEHGAPKPTATNGAVAQTRPPTKSSEVRG